MRKLLVVSVFMVLFVVLPLGNVLAAPAGAGVNDAFKAMWAAETIRDVFRFELMVGYPPDYDFHPNDNITRAEFATVLARAMGLYLDNGKTVWYQPFVDALFEKGVLLSKNGPWDVAIKRGEMAAWVGRALTVLNVPPVREVKTFPDLPESYPEYADIAKASQYAIIEGYPDGTFGPEKTATRAETATMIMRMVPQPRDKAPTKDDLLAVMAGFDEVDKEARLAAVKTKDGRAPAEFAQRFEEYATHLYVTAKDYGQMDKIYAERYFYPDFIYSEVKEYTTFEPVIMANTVAKVKVDAEAIWHMKDGKTLTGPVGRPGYIYFVKGRDGKWRESEVAW